MTDRCEPLPELRDRDGWHWIVWTPDDNPEPYNPSATWWDSDAQSWCPDIPNTDAPRVLAQYRYLFPVATPAEVEALRAERDALRADLQRCENACFDVQRDNVTLRARVAVLDAAGLRALNYIENTESEQRIKLGCGDALRAALGGTDNGR